MVNEHLDAARMHAADLSNDVGLTKRAASAGRAGAWQYEIEQKRVTYTASLQTVLAFDPGTFDGSPESVAALVHSDDREHVLRQLRDALRTGKCYESELRALRPDGDYGWLRVCIEVERQGDRSIRAIGTAVCIDARKRAELGRAEIEQRFTKLFHASPLSVTLASLDTGRLLEVSEAFVTLTGFTREEALGRTSIELGLWPSAADRETVLSALREGGAVRNQVVHLRARNGEERVGLLSAEHVLVDGKPHALTLFEDITLRERAQAALRDSEQRLRLALHAANAGVWQMDMLTGEISWSDEFRKLYGYDDVMTPGRDAWATHLHPEDRERMLTDLRTRLKPGTDEYRREFRILHPTRGLRWILALGQIERNEHGWALGMTGISIDITRIKEVEQELREADERKNEFLAVLAHELRNPLAPLRNGLEILRLTHGSGEVADQARTMMARQLEQMVRLVDDLLEVSRISRGKIELKRAPIDLTVPLQHALEVSKPLIDAAGHDLTIDIPPGPLIVDADVTRLAQVFGNLLNNAAKYTNPGGRISLAVRRTGTDISVSVRDNGVGLAREMLPKIFEMFAQVDHSLQRTQGGLGIGLSIAKRLVEMHGGTLEAHSEGLGQGCEFTVHLPLHVPRATDDKTPATTDSDSALENALRLLVADDNVDAAASLALMLEMKGHQVRTAHDGADAVQVAAAFRPDVVFLDIGMPRLDGYEACRQIRALANGADMLIVALSGWGQAEDKQRSKDAGFDHHLVKPADVGVLEELLRERAIRGGR